MTVNLTDRIRNFTKTGRRTLLGIGPMSSNIIDVTIDLAEEHNTPLMLIASRRQIDSSEHGGGYVNNWCTEQFSEYVHRKNRKSPVILARDHGGPWQNDGEKQARLPLAKAMASAKRSYELDIDSGFSILHIDPSLGLDGPVRLQDSLNRAFELYEHCWQYAAKSGKKIAFEIGTEEQQPSNSSALEALEFQLKAITDFCNQQNIPRPLYVVAQTGTKVMELRNIGSFDAPVRVSNEVPSEILVPKIIELCENYSIFLKQHNTDYLSTAALRAHPQLGIHAANVAPEFGVAETKAYLQVFDIFDLKTLKDEFINLALESQKWRKWMLPSTNANDLTKAVICGHYIFGTHDFHEIKIRLEAALRNKNFDVEYFIKSKIKESIMRYMNSFNLAKDL